MNPPSPCHDKPSMVMSNSLSDQLQTAQLIMAEGKEATSLNNSLSNLINQGNSQMVRAMKKRSRVRGDDVPMTFPQRLMELLSNDAHGDIIGWLPHGRGFMIYQKKRFAAEIMPKYFKKSKFTSFTRKLNRWNFTRITRGPETGAYYHELFQRGNLRLCMQMCCQAGKNGGPLEFRPSLVASRPLSDGDPLAFNRLLAGMTDTPQTTTTDFAAMGLLGNQQLSSPLTQLTDTTGVLQQTMRTLEAPHSPHITQHDLALHRPPHHHQLHQPQLQQQLQQQQQQAEEAQQRQLLAALAGGPSCAAAPSVTINTSAPVAAGGQPDIALRALQRNNTNSYLNLLVAQEKMQAQLGSLDRNTTAASTLSQQLDLQRQQQHSLLQQDQVDRQRHLQAVQRDSNHHFANQQQRLLQAQAAALQQPTTPRLDIPSMSNLPPNLLKALLQPAPAPPAPGDPPSQRISRPGAA